MLLLSFWAVAPAVSHLNNIRQPRLRVPQSGARVGSKHGSACCPAGAPVVLHYHKSGNVLSATMQEYVAKEVREP